MNLVPADSPHLRERAEDVFEVNDDVRAIAADMLALMYAKNGIGLAANQVGILTRIIVIDLSREKNNAVVMINPTILKATGEQTYPEGCLSFPGRKVEVTRAARVKVRYQDEDGDSRTIKASALFAQCIQHEIDHLNGICIGESHP
ncbi:MAG TPA: peptide deformylase [Gammaproteobacteria bacterium]|nr:peptide deformylase [Gammaproteobacteria bacterium]